MRRGGTLLVAVRALYSRRAVTRRVDADAVPHDDRLCIEGVDKVTPNAKVCVDVEAERFLQLFISRISGK